MSVSKMTFIYCDGGDECPRSECYAYSDASHFPAWKQREFYSSDDWLFKGGKDYCPDCVKRLALSPDAGGERVE